MAYHLAQEARAGLSEFQLPSDFGNKGECLYVAAMPVVVFCRAARTFDPKQDRSTKEQRHGACAPHCLPVSHGC